MEPTTTFDLLKSLADLGAVVRDVPVAVACLLALTLVYFVASAVRERLADWREERLHDRLRDIDVEHWVPRKR